MLNSKYYNIYFLFFSIVFLSATVFSYDEEKIVVLCLISFATIIYHNFHEAIFNALNEQSILLKKELVDLFSDKIIIMRKLRYSWRIFLDIEDTIVDMYCWVKIKFKKIIQEKSKRRLNFFWKYLIRKDLNKLYQLKLIIKENFKMLILNQLKKKSLNFSEYNINTLNSLKTLTYNYTIKHIILNKLNKNVSNLNLNLNTYYYLKW